MYFKPHQSGGFAAAYGYPNYENALQQRIVSDTVIPKFSRRLIASSYTTPVWFDPIRRVGNTVEYFMEPCVSVRDYVKDVEMKAETPTFDKRTLTLGEAKYADFKVDEVDEMRIAGFSRFVRSIANAASVAFAEECDKTVGKKSFMQIHPMNKGDSAGCEGCDDLGTCENPLVWEEATIDAILLLARKIMRRWSVPKNEWFIRIPDALEPAMIQRMMSGTGNGSCCIPGNRNEMAFEGEIGSHLGFDVLSDPCSNKCGEKTYRLLFGSKNAVAFAKLMSKARVMSPHTSFEKRFQWLMLYGCDTMKPEYLGEIVVTTQSV